MLTRLLATAVVTAGLTALPAATPPSGASSRYLCTGYSTCAQAGYSHAGYASRNDRMYWRMYAGHNCTNYVAYRMIQRGMSTERPWDGSGMAYNWGHAMDDITDTRPAVGSVAWWDRGVSGAGSSGHVAYVEKVVSPTEIVISEDSWSGDFHWRTIYKDGTSWPTGFIHFVDREEAKVVEATAPPRIDQPAQVGAPLRGFVGRFTPSTAQHSLQWLVDGQPVRGATGQTYTPTPADAGKVVTLRDTGSLAGHTSAVTTSAPTEPVARGVLAASAGPTLSGTAEVGQVLTATPAAWSPRPDSVNYRWRADRVWLPEFNGSTFTLTRDLVGKRISVVTVARARGYTKALAATASTAPVLAGAVELAEPFRASGEARHGSSLTFTPGTWSPADARAGYAWFRDGVQVTGATGTSYAVGDGDVGRRITVRATVSRRHYRGLTRSADYGVVTSPSTMELYAGGRVRGAVARVRITAPGVAEPTGPAWARIGDDVVRVELVDGAAELRLTGIAPGRRTMVVLYGGDGVAERVIRTVTVVVKR